ncbi:MAG: terminase small subunit [Nitrosomonas sp.]|nr:terminase small subunit [Nitrosomonas sp.]
MKKDGLTPLEESLCQAYLISKDKSEALRKSKYKTNGWSPASINRKAKELFDKVKIASRVAELLEKRSERTNIGADYVLRRLAEIDQMDAMDILDSDGNIKPLRDWPKSWRTTISGLDLHEIMSGDTETVIRKIKWPDKIKNLELIGRHVDVQAWRDRIETEDVTDYAKLLESRASAAERLRNSTD